MAELDALFARLKRSTFRSRFRLRGRELAYLQDKGIEHVLEHARRLIAERLAPAGIPNDGRQTPMRNHPVFVAQHATATCCRGCLQKWHGIEKGRALSEAEVDYVIRVIGHWLQMQPTAPSSDVPVGTRHPRPSRPPLPEPGLFD